jgi:putative transcriptional regulator
MGHTKCDVCKGTTSLRTESNYHYVESGLDNVYLKNLSVQVCDSCGEKSLLIPRIVSLHATIGKAVAMQPCPLRGSDIRFLRKQLGFSAKVWASFLRTDISTLSRWENSQQGLGTQSDTLIRLLYFRIRDEREGTLGQERVVEAVAAVNNTDCGVNLKVNIGTPHSYQYQTLGTASGDLRPQFPA